MSDGRIWLAGLQFEAEGSYPEFSRKDVLALIRVVRAAARVNELVGTETEDGQAAAWTELDAALGAFEV